MSFQVVDYKANKRRKQERKKLAGLEKGPTHKDDITVWNDSIHIPNIPPTGLSRCRLIDVKYELEVSHATGRCIVENKNRNDRQKLLKEVKVQNFKGGDNENEKENELA